jgi:superfamily I DNA/RNA helicase
MFLSKNDEKDYNRSIAERILAKCKKDDRQDTPLSTNPSHDYLNGTDDKIKKTTAIIELTGEQKRILTLPLQNPVQIKGVAGSGKTTVAIYRAKHLFLSNEDLFDTTRVCVFSYTKSLVKYVQSMLIDTPYSMNISVTTFHKWAYGFLASHDFWKTYSVAKRWDTNTILNNSLRSLQKQNPTRAVLLKSIEFYREEITWLKGRLFILRQDYIDAKRTGRGTSDRVTSSDKELIWDVYAAYNSGLKEKNMVDFDDYATLCLELINNNPDFAPPFSHVVVDEAQDFSAAQLIVLTKLVKQETNSITIIADAAQRIYKSGFAWVDVGINVRGGRSVELKRNYRNTKQIAEAALSLLSHDPQSSDFSEHLVPDRNGPMPIIKYVRNYESQLSEVIKFIASIDLSKESIAVLHRSRQGVENITFHLQQKKIPCTNIISGLTEAIIPIGIYTCTMSSIKGLEFDYVIICDLNDDIIPYPPGFADDNDELHISTERRLLYMCMTRAKKQLLLISTGMPSRYLGEIDINTVEVHSGQPN